MRPDLQDIVDRVSRLLSAPVTLEDRDFQLVAFGSQSGGIDAVRQRSILDRRSAPEVREFFERFGIATSDVPVRTPADPARDLLARVCLPARWNGVTYGYLWLLDERHDLDDAVLGAAMHSAARAGAIMAQQARAKERMSDRLQDLLSPDPGTAEAAAEEIAELGVVDRDVPVVAVVLRTVPEPAAHAVPINLWRLPQSVLAATDQDHLTLLAPLADAADPRPAHALARQALALYAEQLPPDLRPHAVAGLGAPRPDLVHARESWREARLALRASAEVPALRPVASWPDLGIYRLLACGPPRALRHAVLDDAARRLLDHGDPVLLATATTYLDEAGNVQRSAAALGIHRQTLYHRLGRIQQITGTDLERGQDRLRLHLALTLSPLLHPGTP
ncbi:helix-turn-helix domain-containing protein [Longispora sp. NPDC051575]|uniref:PucR family transcriptional regulator n=1 Tax=Longispora sp. NPDC051575 TaxID=3154943 RepID=UPI00342A8048